MFERIKSFFIVSEEVRLKNMTNNVVIWKMIKLIFWGSLFGGLALYALLKPIINPPTTQIENLVLTMIACIFFGAITWAYGGTFLTQIFNEFRGNGPNEVTEKDTLSLYLNKTTHKFSPQIFDLVNQFKLTSDEKAKKKLLAEFTKKIDSEILYISESNSSSTISKEALKTFESSSGESEQELAHCASSDNCNDSKGLLSNEEPIIHIRTKNNYLRLIMELAGHGVAGFNPKHPHPSADLIKEVIDSKIESKTIARYIKEAYMLSSREKMKSE